MGKNTNFVSHKKSKLKDLNGGPQLPEASALVEGEIAINFAENVETLSIKNESGDVVTFSSDNYYTEKKLGSGFTSENSGVTVTDAILWVSGTGENAIVQKSGGNTASGKLSVAMGRGTIASGDYSVAEGYQSSATSLASHAEGNAIANGNTSHAEGNAIANGSTSHAEGNTVANGSASHAEGNWTEANGFASHAEGGSTVASGWCSHAEGSGTVAYNKSEHASGQYNVSNSASTEFGDSGNTLFSVGNGTADNARHNAFEIMQNGDIYISSGGTDILLQDNLGGNIEIDQVIDSGTSASTDAVSTSAVYNFVTSYAPSIEVDQDFSDTASTNPISTKAVYSAITDNELVWTNAFVALSGTVSAHTANTEIHVTAADKTRWDSKADKSDLGGLKLVKVTQAEYDVLATKDPNTLYVIVN